MAAAPLLCAGITTYSPIAQWNVGPGQKVAVLGLGGLGHMGVQIAAAKGADVTVLSRSLRKAKFAEKLGAARTLATSDDNFFRDRRGEFDFILKPLVLRLTCRLTLSYSSRVASWLVSVSHLRNLDCGLAL